MHVISLGIVQNYSITNLPVENIYPEPATMVKLWHINMYQLVKVNNISKTEEEDDKRNDDR